jgi:catechol-2,3-dioxygenase
VARLVGINHVALEVGDIGEALEFYGRFFEFELRGRRSTMAWIDAGDQFIALSVAKAPLAVPSSGGARSARSSVDAEDQERRTKDKRVNQGGLDHVGIVVDDKEAVRRTAQEAGLDVAASGHLRIRDPWGNVLEIVDYRDVQFSKTAEVLRGMGLDGLEKSERALGELREKGLAG